MRGLWGVSGGLWGVLGRLLEGLWCYLTPLGGGFEGSLGVLGGLWGVLGGLGAPFGGLVVLLDANMAEKSNKRLNK